MNKVRGALRSKTAGDSVWALGDQFGSLLSLIVSAKLLTHSLGEDGFSGFSAVYGLMGPFLAFIQSGVSLAVLDFIVRERRDPKVVADSYLGYVWTVGGALALVVIGLTYLVNDAVPIGAAALLILSEFLIMSGMWATTATIQAARGYKFAAMVRIIVSSCRTTLLIALFVADRLTITSLAVCQSMMYVGLALVIHRWHERTYGATFRPGRFSFGDLRATAVYGVGLSAIGVQDSYDQVTLNSVDKHLGGYYAAAYKIISAGLMPLNAIANATHMDFLHVDENSNDQVRKTWRFTLLGLAYSIVFCIVVIIAAPVVPVLLGDEFEGAVPIIRWLCPLVPLRGLGTFPMNGLLGLGRNRLRTQILVGSAATSLLLYLTMIPAWTWKGAVAAALISEVLLFSAAWTALIRSQSSYDRQRPLQPA